MAAIDQRFEPLATALGHALASDIEAVEQLTGGASRETFRIETADSGSLILQRERTAELRRPEGMAAEADVLRAASAAGVPVPEVLISNADVDAPEIGASFFVTRAVAGETIARRILRSETFVDARAALPRQLGAALAGVHRVDTSGLGFLEAGDELTKYRLIADDLGLARPAFELAFRWLEAARPPDRPRSLVHGDFRLGNLIVDHAGLAAVIDWELAHIGDPMEDLGWASVRAWRFGGSEPVAGVGSHEEVWAAYEQAGGAAVDPAVVAWWHVLGELKWGIMCALQADTHRSGRYRSLELLAIGRRITEQEHAVSSAIAEADARPALANVESGESLTTRDRPDLPTAEELLEALGERLEVAVDRPLGGFEARVARNVTEMVRREVNLGAEIDQRHSDHLAAFGVASDAEWSQHIRSGALDDRFDDVLTAVTANAADRLSIDNPRWLTV